MNKKPFIIFSQSRKDCQPQVMQSPQCSTCGSTEFTTQQLTFVNLRESRAQNARPTRRKVQPEGRQLTVWESQQKPETTPYLQIASIPVDERVNPFEHRYCLVILPYGVRACGGQFTADEAHQIAQAMKQWDWSLDEAGRLRCLPALEGLVDSICKRSSQKGGEA